MKNQIRTLVTVFSLFFCYACSQANGLIVCIADQTSIDSILADNPVIQEVDHAGKSPFFRFEVDSNWANLLESSLLADKRIVWVESETPSGFRQQRSSHGSSVAAIFDRTASFDRNSDVQGQINFRTFDRSRSALRVGIVDTGVSPLQPSICLRVVAGESFVDGSTSIDDLPTNIDTNMNGVFDEGAGHGTMIAGIILRTAPNCDLVIAKSADSDGIANSWSVIKGVVFCVENRAKLINLSLGSSKPLTGFSQFLDWVEDSGSLIIAPIGNNNLSGSLFPAGYPKVVCVTGLLPDNTKAPFSNWDSCARVAAPATGIFGHWYDGGTTNWSGTSLAAPFVTGSLASAMANNPNLSPGFLRYALVVSGVDIDDLNPLYRCQLGRLLDVESLAEMLRG